MQTHPYILHRHTFCKCTAYRVQPPANRIIVLLLLLADNRWSVPKDSAKNCLGKRSAIIGCVARS